MGHTRRPAACVVVAVAHPVAPLAIKQYRVDAIQFTGPMEVP